MGELSSHVLEYLSWAKGQEVDPWLRDDRQIAYLTVLWAARGHPRPDIYATQLTLGVTPAEVWPRIVADRKAKLGKLYSKFFYTATDLPRPEEEDKKPPRSERSTTTARKRQRG